MSPTIVAVSASADHRVSKQNQVEIRLVEGQGVEGDAHAGPTVRHRSRVRRNPGQSNLRQVHLMHAELFKELEEAGFRVGPGDMGENITTRGIDLLSLPAGTRLCVGREAVIEVTGLRNPCRQLEGIQPGLMAAVLHRDRHGDLIRKAGIMGVVIAGGIVRAGDAFVAVRPRPPFRALHPV